MELDPYYVPDPEEERLKQEAAIAALAASGGMPEPEPVELPEQVAPVRPDPIELGQLDIYSTPEPSGAEIGALPALPDPQTEGTAHPNAMALPLGDDPRAPAFSALAAAGQSKAPVPDPMSPTPAPPPAAATPSAPEPPPQQDPFEALMLRGEEQRRKQLEAYDREGAPGVNGWALLADVAFNKGRSIPGILQQADADKRAYREGRQKLLTGGAHSDPVSQMLAMERIKTGQGNLAARTGGQEARAEALRKESEADALAGDRFRQYAQDKGFYDPSMEGLGGKALAKQFPMRREDKTLALAPELNAAAGEKAEEQSKGRIRGEHELRGEKAETAGAVRGAQVDEEIRALPDRPMTPQQQAADDRAAESLRLQRQAAEDRERDRNEALATRKTEKDRAWITDYGNKHIKQIDSAKLVDDLDDAIAAAEAKGELPPGLGVEQIKEGVDKYPLGQTGRSIAALVGTPEYNDFQTKADYNRKLVARLGESVYRIDTGASGNEREEMRAAIASAMSPTATLDDIKNSLKILRTRLTSQLGNSAAAAPDLAEQSLAGGGISNTGRWLGHLRKQPAADGGGAGGSDAEFVPANEPEFDAAKPPPSRKHAPRSPSATNLGVTPGTPPKVDASPKLRSVTVVYDDGTSEETDPLDEATIARLRGKRGVVEVR